MQQQPPSCSPATSSRPSKKRDAIPLWALPLDCPTGVAVIQLAKPLDGSETLQVVTYNAEGAVRGQYSDLTALGREQPSFTFTPVGAPTTDRREMVDGSGQRWAMSGHHSFELEEIGGYGNRISVSSPCGGTKRHECVAWELCHGIHRGNKPLNAFLRDTEANHPSIPLLRELKVNQTHSYE